MVLIRTLCAPPQLIAEAGGDGITAHLREDRRHITDRDIERIAAECALPLNFEMAATAEMLAIARNTKPNACCLVPEKREERTTESGLDVIRSENELAIMTGELQDVGSRVSLFVDANREQIDAAKRVGADIVELHTGTYCEAEGTEQQIQLERLIAAAKHAAECGIEVHAGHGLSYGDVKPVAAIPQLVELNIGHFLIGEAVFRGFCVAVSEMRRLMDKARAS